MNNLKNLKEKIEKMSKYHQVEILRVLVEKHNIAINENNNGVFINLTELDYIVIEDLFRYSNYVEVQETQLGAIESEKERIHNSYFTQQINM